MTANTAMRICSLRTSKARESTVLKKLRNARSDLNLAEIAFWHLEATPAVVQSLRKLFFRDGRKFDTLKFFFLTGDVASVLSLIFDNASTQRLVLQGTSLDQPSLLTLRDGLATTQSLRSLKLAGTQFATEQTNIVWEGLARNVSLSELDLTYSHVAPCSVGALAQALSCHRTMTTLNLCHCDLDDDSLTRLYDALRLSAIRFLDASKNTPGPRALAALTQLVASPSCTLQELSLSHQHVILAPDSCSEWEARLAHLVHALLECNTSLRSLDLSENNLADPQLVTLLASSLATNTTLLHLDLASCKISNEGIQCLGRHLPDFTNLRTLNIADNRCDDNANMDATTAQVLLQGLQPNRCLTSLGGSGGPSSLFPGMPGRKLQHLLDLNRAGRRALQKDVPLAVWPQVLARAASLDWPSLDEEKEEGIQEEGRTEAILFALLQGPALFGR